MKWKEELIKAFNDTGAIQKGLFRLSSGGISSYYIDARKVTLNYIGLFSIVKGILEITWNHDLNYTSIGGPSIGADPIIGAALIHLPVTNGFLIRKESKDHGTQKLIEGNLTNQYLLVEDVVTTGKSILHCINTVGYPPAVIITVLDRSDGEIKEYCEAQKIGYYPLLTLEDLGVQRD